MNYQDAKCLLRAWDIAVASFRYGRPEAFSSFEAFWFDEYGPGNEEASQATLDAFETLRQNKLKLPAFISRGD